MTTESILAPVAALQLPDSTRLTRTAEGALEFIQSFEVVDAETYGFAADELQAIKSRRNAIEKQRTGITGPINDALRAINALFKGPAELLEQGERLIKSKMLAYQQEQERIAAEARRKAEESAAAERKRLEEEAAERQRQAQAHAAAAAAAAAAGDAQAAQIATANAQREQAAAASAALESQVVTAAVVAPAAPRAKGIATTTRIDFEVVDLMQLIQHVAKHPELINLVVADSVKLRAYVRGLGVACALPGVRVFEDRGISARAA